MQLVFVTRKTCSCGGEVYVELTQRGPARIPCPKCGFVVEVGPGELAVEVRLYDCEVRDWERIGALSTAVQQRVLQAVESGRAPKELWPLLVKLRDSGALICT